MRKLDRTDIGILNSLQENARITNACLLYTSDAADE